MALSTFSIFVSIDAGNGIAKDGEIPWESRSDGKFFRDTTYGRGRNAVIMGRNTYESIPEEARPLEGRHNIVISRTWKQESNPGITICENLLEALAVIGGTAKNYDDVFIIGGEQLYREAIFDYGYLCNRIYVTRFKTDYGCDQFFPWEAVCKMKTLQDPQKTRDYTRYIFKPKEKHPEYFYLKSLQQIIDEGETKIDRTNTGTLSCFGLKMEFDISNRIPILTTKKVNYDSIIKELLFFVSGKTDTKILEAQNVKIWEGNTSREFLDSQKLREYEVGDMGPMYGHQFRHWGAEYKGADQDYTNQGIDQLAKIIENIKTNPHSRRHILSAWNVSDLDKMCLNPCHCLVQFNVSGDRRFLDCQLYQRSGDMFLGIPFNITSYCLLTYMIAHVTGLKPRKFIHIIGDAHIYSNHLDQTRRQITRTPRPFPKLSFRGGARIHNIEDFTFSSFVIEGYNSCPAIIGKMAV